MSRQSCSPSGRRNPDLGPETDRLILLPYGRGPSALTTVAATVGGQPGQVLFAGPSPEFPGVDQVNLRIPCALGGSGEVDVSVTVDGRAANPVRIQIR